MKTITEQISGSEGNVG